MERHTNKLLLMGKQNVRILIEEKLVCEVERRWNCEEDGSQRGNEINNL